MFESLTLHLHPLTDSVIRCHAAGAQNTCVLAREVMDRMTMMSGGYNREERTERRELL